ncbi:MAG TPA: amidase [Bradyrhizobium sp.]
MTASSSIGRSGRADFGAFIPGPRCVRAPTASGSLDGLTFAVKDLIDVAGTPTGGGNPDWQKVQSPAARSAPAVEALLAAGASLAGKTITDELAFSLQGVNAHHGTPVNPACPDRIPGGSSSGSAVAVAAKLVDFAIGTDTGGSVRVPASFVGVCGFRPTHDAISLAGVMPFAPSYDTVGWFARDAAMLSRVGGVLLPNASPKPVHRFRLVRDALALADPGVAEALRRSCAAFDIDEISLFEGQEQQWLECYRVLQGAEIWTQLGPWISSAKPRFGDKIAPRFADAASITPADVARYQPIRVLIARRVREALGDGIGLLIPTAPCIALRIDAGADEIGTFYRNALTLTSIAGHAGIPQISLPAGKVAGCPIGLSVLASPGHDRALLDLGVRYADAIGMA